MLNIVPCPGNKAVRKHIKNIAKNTRRGIQNAHRGVRTELKKDTVAEMHKAKSGRLYTVNRGRGGKKLAKARLHRASSKTEAPAVLTGALKKSLGFTFKTGHILTYGANTPYARRWELSRRRYLWRTIKKKNGEIMHWYEQEIQKSLELLK